MDQQATIADFERRAAAVGQKLYTIALAAGLSPSTYYRWKAGSRAGFDGIVAVRAELEKVEATHARKDHP